MGSNLNGNSNPGTRTSYRRRATFLCEFANQRGSQTLPPPIPRYNPWALPNFTTDKDSHTATDPPKIAGNSRPWPSPRPALPACGHPNVQPHRTCGPFERAPADQQRPARHDALPQPAQPETEPRITALFTVARNGWRKRPPFWIAHIGHIVTPNAAITRNARRSNQPPISHLKTPNVPGARHAAGWHHRTISGSTAAGYGERFR